jgi:hypothetical protein
MAELPSIPDNVPQVRAPQSRVSPGQIAQPYNELAASLDTTAGVLMKDVAKPAAEEAGLRAVTHDANGNIQVDRVPVFGEAANDYLRAMKVKTVADVESVARQDDIALRQQFHDAPDKYLIAAEEYRQAKVKQYTDIAGAEVGVAIDRSIGQQTTLTYKGLLNEKEHLDLQRANLSIGSEIGRTENELTALANQGDTSSPEFQSRIAKIQALNRERVNNPRLAFPQAQADFQMDQLKGELRAQAMLHHVGEIATAKGPDEALKEAERLRTDATLNLNSGQRDNFYNRAVGVINQQVRQQGLADKSVADEITAVNKLAEGGQRPSPGQMATLGQMVAGNNNPAVRQFYEQSVQNIDALATWRQMSPAQLTTELSKLDRHMQAEGVTEQTSALRQSGAKLLTQMEKAIKDDPIGWADRVGTVQSPPINFAAPTATAEMRGRIAMAEVIAQQYDNKLVYLRPEERRMLQVSTAGGGPAMLTTARSIVDGFGDRAGAVLKEVSKDAPVLAHMGGLLSGGLFGGGSPAFAQDVAEGIALQQNPETKKQLPKWATERPAALYQSEADRKVAQYGDAFLLAPDSASAAEASAKSAFMARAVHRGDDPRNFGTVTKAYDRALQEGAGATFNRDGVQFGGIADYKPGYWSSYKVLVPGSIRADRFRDVIGAITDDDLQKMPISPQGAAGKPYTAAELRNAVPVAAAGGYRFAQGDPASTDPKWLRGADGQPFVLKLDAIEPVLRTRVPGAFGGR